MKKNRRKAANVKAPGDKELLKTKQNKQLAVDFDEELRLFKEEKLEKERLKLEVEEEGGEKTKRQAPELIVFEDPRRRKKKKVVDQDRSESNEEEFNLKKARYEVRQFGLTGFSFEDREKCEMDRAIQLGAWRPKREYINYKKLMSMQKKTKEEQRQQQDIDRKMGYKVVKKPTADKIKPRVRNQGFWRDSTQDKKFFLDGQVGRYKQGVQVVSRDDISRVKTRSKKGNVRGSSKNIKF